MNKRKCYDNDDDGLVHLLLLHFSLFSHSFRKFI